MLSNLGTKEKVIIPLAIVFIGYMGWSTYKSINPSEDIVIEQSDSVPYSNIHNKHKHKHKKKKKKIKQINTDNFWNQSYIRSPFFSPISVKEKPLKVQGIIKTINSKEYKVMINNVIYTKGMSVNGFKLLKIKQNSVKVKSLKTEITREISIFE